MLKHLRDGVYRRYFSVNGIRDRAKYGTYVATNSGEKRNNSDRNQRNNKCIFNKALTAF